MKPERDEVEYCRQRIAIVDALRRAFERVKTRTKLTKRERAVFAEELGADYSLYFEPNRKYPFTGGEIEVWGSGIDHTERMHLSWSDKADGQPQTWQEGLARDLERQDCRDSLERLEQEERLIKRLAALEDKVEAARQEASDLIAALPIPKSATIRAKPIFWERPSANLKKRFPNLFSRLED